MRTPTSLYLCFPMALALSAMAHAQTAPATPPKPPAAPTPAPTTDDITVTGQVKADLPRLPGGKDFISPMGEPFHSKDELSGAEHWFAQTDTNGDGRVTLAEFKADEERFFAILDSDHDGDIGPIELQYYEDELAPEVKTLNTWGNTSKAKFDKDGNVVEPPYPERLGAGVIAYLPFPEPVIYADTNIDRGVSRREFDIAAEKRFQMLDRNGDGKLTRAELPRPGG